MTEPDVCLSDYAIFLECTSFTYLLMTVRPGSAELSAWSLTFFASTALAAATGGTVHGFFPEEGSLGHEILWPLTLIAVGTAAMAGLHIGAELLFSHSTADTIGMVATAGFVLYICIVLFVRHDFFIAILGYLPALLLLATAFFMAFHNTGDRSFQTGFFGVCLMLIAAAAQHARVRVHRRYFNHNALYHLLQGVALYMVFVAVRAGLGLRELHH